MSQPAPLTPLSWFNQKGYAQGVFWIILVSLISNMNDILMRLSGDTLPGIEITFFRYFFATLSLLPIMIYKGKSTFVTARPVLHIVRSLLLFIAIALWVQGLKLVPLAVVSTMALTVPIVVLPLAAIILHERIGLPRILATIVGFIGIFYIISDGFKWDTLIELSQQNAGSLYLVIAVVCFALSDIINKKYVVSESTLSMLFYLALGTMLISAIPAAMTWMTPSPQELMYLFALGLGGNLILFCLLKAFSATDVSALAPYRYVELIFATFFGWLIFTEFPTHGFWWGCGMIILSTASISYYEIKMRRG